MIEKIIAKSDSNGDDDDDNEKKRQDFGSRSREMVMSSPEDDMHCFSGVVHNGLETMILPMVRDSLLASSRSEYYWCCDDYDAMMTMTSLL